MKKDGLSVIYTIVGFVIIAFALGSTINASSRPNTPDPTTSPPLTFSSISPSNITQQMDEIDYSLYQETDSLNNLLGSDGLNLAWIIIGATLLVLGEVRPRVKIEKAYKPVGSEE